MDSRNVESHADGAQVLAEFRATTTVAAPAPPPVRTEAEKAEIKRFEAEHGREFAPSSLSEADIAEPLRIQARANVEHPPPWKELRLRNRPDGALEVHAVARANAMQELHHRNLPDGVVVERPQAPRRQATTSPKRRAQSGARRSGASRDGPSDEPEPPLLGRPCEVCGQQFTPRRRSDARICSQACKQRAYRKRQRQVRLAALEERIEPAVLLEWAGDDPLLALDLALREVEIRREVAA